MGLPSVSPEAPIHSIPVAVYDITHGLFILSFSCNFSPAEVLPFYVSPGQHHAILLMLMTTVLPAECTAHKCLSIPFFMGSEPHCPDVCDRGQADLSVSNLLPVKRKFE